MRSAAQDDKGARTQDPAQPPPGRLCVALRSASAVKDQTRSVGDPSQCGDGARRRIGGSLLHRREATAPTGVAGTDSSSPVWRTATPGVLRRSRARRHNSAIAGRSIAGEVVSENSVGDRREVAMLGDPIDRRFDTIRSDGTFALLQDRLGGRSSSACLVRHRDQRCGPGGRNGWLGSRPRCGWRSIHRGLEQRRHRRQ